MRIAFVSLGCDKNLVDSEVMLGLLQKSGFALISDESQADVLVVNTCCFIQDAKEESIESILEMAQYKKTGNCKALIVTGCMAERYKDEILSEIPEVDGVVGTTGYESIVEVVEEILQGKKIQMFSDVNAKTSENYQRVLSTAGYFAYLKIAEGCDNRCTYCIIPQLRGKYRSRSMESLISEAKTLASQGVKELILVAQDTTRYGIDLYGEKKLPQLLKELCKIDDLKWIRLLYCYPEEITDELIDVIAEEEKVCSYLDMPIQHANTSILKRMGRRSTKEDLIHLINKLRKRIPDICLRTTLIVGFPGETDEEYEDLVQFVKDMKFDRLGVFTYSKEEGTPAAKMRGQIPKKIKEFRKDKIMKLQQAICEEKSAQCVGRTLEVIIDGKLPEENVYCGRTYRDAPEIDGMVFVSADEDLLSGDFIKASITSSNEYDLIGRIVDESGE
ncbi:30S ribosomal protein S12 methylthiotransferase RimO [Defluviitalea raffinosedens]|uniref:Ribosomal protein uS12 methylthiotransferase RimO n=1 Tax=Defluviitalea raffinosedens TaxID=1450156 RepID=A0A7C8LH13_9FIRM|nr:30S ribosomal protein S12 methylthiotransferase RimO [Defluviitalea raffinosedens]KAE9637356.1 30S ribosomal protein S12 methylthiotransferase RimO [Defluviitalea raffinosedens]